VIYFPLDLRACASRALAALRPRLLLLMESELWPNVIRCASARGVPIAVVNGRLSPRAFARYQAVKPWVQGMLERVSLFLMQAQADADRLLALGVPAEKVRVAGSLKWDASLGARPDASAIQALSARLGLARDEVIVVAGSTHRGEEAAVLDAFGALRATRAGARLILAPRHLERLAEVEALIAHRGLSAARASAISGGGWQVGIVDVFGQLPLYYGLATVVFVGGSLIPHGGQNPLEAASLGKPVVFGPSMHNFEAITHQLLAHHAARQAQDAKELSHLLEELVSQPDEAQAMGRRPRRSSSSSRGPPAAPSKRLRRF
jgi:3-deoxy-D-manno-octulosonic-acid transferase